MIDISLKEVQKLLDNGLIVSAIQLLKEIIDEEPSNYKALHMIGRIYLDQSEPDRAAEFTCRDESSDADLSEDYLLYSSRDSKQSFGNENDNQTWENIVLNEQFFDNEDEDIDYEEVECQGCIPLRHRAQQIVGDLALEFLIDDLLFDQLFDVLVFYKCHGQTKKSMRILLGKNLQAEELVQIFELRDYWCSNEGFSRNYYGNSCKIGYTTLSWVLGLAIIRRLGCEDVEEAILYIEDCFEDWSRSLRLLNGFRSFRLYMMHLMEHEELTGTNGLAPYIDYQLFPDDESLPIDFMSGTVYKWLEENNLLHKEVVPWYPEIVKPPESDEMEDE